MEVSGKNSKKILISLLFTAFLSFSQSQSRTEISTYSEEKLDKEIKETWDWIYSKFKTPYFKFHFYIPNLNWFGVTDLWLLQQGYQDYFVSYMMHDLPSNRTDSFEDVILEEYKMIYPFKSTRNVNFKSVMEEGYVLDVNMIMDLRFVNFNKYGTMSASEMHPILFEDNSNSRFFYCKRPFYPGIPLDTLFTKKLDAVYFPGHVQMSYNKVEDIANRMVRAFVYLQQLLRARYPKINNEKF